jgi:hypothetical protein
VEIEVEEDTENEEYDLLSDNMDNFTVALLREVIGESDDEDEDDFLTEAPHGARLEALRQYTRFGVAPRDAPDVCGVCQEPIKGGQIYREMRCHHIFHLGCVDRALETTPSCPMCRATVAPEAGASVVFDSEPAGFGAADASQ